MRSLSPRMVSSVCMLSLGFFDGILGVAWIAAHTALNASIDQLGWILGFMGIGSALGAVTAPWLTRTYHPLVVLRGALMVQMCLMLMIFTVPSIAGLAIFYGLRGLANGMAHATLNGYFGPRIGAKKLMTVHGSWGIGTATAGLIAGIALDLKAPWFVAYLMGALLCAVGIAQLFRIRQRFDVLEPLASLNQSSDRITWSLGIVAVIVSGALYVGLEQSVGNWTGSLLMNQFSLDGGLTGIAVGLFWGALTIGRFTLGLLPISERTLLLVSSVVLCLTLLGLLVAPSPALAIIALTTAGLAMAPLAPFLLSLGSQMVPRQQHMTLTSLQIVAFSLGAAAIPALLGLTAATAGLSIIYIGFLGVAIALCVGVIISLHDSRETRPC